MGTRTSRGPGRRVAPGRSLRPSGLRGRLVAIAALPVLGLIAFATSVTWQRVSELRMAERVAAPVGRLLETLDAQAAFKAERVPSQTKASSQAFGLPPAAVGLLMGMDPDERLRVARPRVDAALAAPRFTTVRDQVERARDAARRGAAADDLVAMWQSVDLTLARLRDADLADVEREIGQLREGGREHGSLDALLAAATVVEAQSTQFEDLFALRSSGQESRPLRTRLAASVARMNQALDTIGEMAGPRAREAFTAMVASPELRESRDVLDRALAQPTVPLQEDFIGAARAFRPMLVTSDLSATMVAGAAEDLGDRARTIRDEARRSLAVAFLVSVTVSGLAILMALRSARSIAKPLHALAVKAERIAQGELDTGPLPESGPHETVVVTRALNDLVTNLGTLDRQVLAIAQGDLDAPVLQTWLPGGLAASVRDTVQRLSASMRRREELREQLAHQAAHDDLTGLPNRSAIMSTLAAAIERSGRQQTLMACIFIDLDGFKRANDTFGHRFGDDVLRVCAERLAREVRGGDTIGRLGGDEFVVIAEGLESAADAAATLAARFVEVLTGPVEIDERVTMIGASAGVAVDLDRTATAMSLLRDADRAVYRAKERGRGVVEVFDAALRADVERRTDIEEAFGRALGTDQLRVVFQPVVAYIVGAPPRVVSFESLIRWDRPGEGPVSPAEFVPMLERGPLIVDLGLFVLRDALAQLAVWQRHALSAQVAEPVSVAVNLSSRHLASSRVVDDVMSAVRTSGIDPSSLIIEITETALVDDVSAVAIHLEALRAAGIRIALDDFGSGFTSVSQLACLPVDILKIDRSFSQAVTDPSRRPIVEMMIGVGRTLGLSVVAEGVEVAEHADLLAALGCETQQGWFHGYPESGDDARERLAARALTPAAQHT